MGGGGAWENWLTIGCLVSNIYKGGAVARGQAEPTIVLDQHGKPLTDISQQQPAFLFNPCLRHSVHNNTQPSLCRTVHNTQPCLRHSVHNNTQPCLRRTVHNTQPCLRRTVNNIKYTSLVNAVQCTYRVPYMHCTIYIIQYTQLLFKLYILFMTYSYTVVAVLPILVESMIYSSTDKLYSQIGKVYRLP